MTLAIVLMGVSGSGKTSIGQALSAELGWSFYDGDDFHSPENVGKMSKGIPLNDIERIKWLVSLHKLVSGKLKADENLVLACSALKSNYRQLLRSGNDGLVFVFLKGDIDLIWGRMETRNDHYMKSEMLKSQFEILEPPKNALHIDIDRPITEIVREISAFLAN